MLYLKYFNEEEKHLVDFKMISTNVCQIMGDFPVKRVGFILSRIHSDLTIGEYLDFNTIYRKIDGGVQFSDDGSVYVAPPEPEPVEEPKPYIPTLDEVKLMKIEELSTVSKQMIENGVDVEIDGKIEHFSYKTEDETDINDTYNTLMLTGLGQSLHADGDGGNCKVYTPEQVTMIYISQKANKMHHKTYFNQLKGYVNSLDDKETVETVSYGVPLTGQYLENYNLNMENAKLNIQVAMQKVENTYSEGQEEKQE